MPPSIVQLKIVNYWNEQSINEAFIYVNDIDIIFQSDSSGSVTLILPEKFRASTLNLLIQKNGFASRFLTLSLDSINVQPILVKLQRYYPQPSGIGFNIVGKIIDQENRPIEGVQIFVANIEQSYLSDKNGQFALRSYELFPYDQIHLFFVKENYFTTNRTIELPTSTLEPFMLDPIKMVSSKTIETDVRQLRFHFQLDKSSHSYLKILYHSPLLIKYQEEVVGEIKSDTSATVKLNIPKNKKKVSFKISSNKFYPQMHEQTIGDSDEYIIPLHLQEPYLEILIQVKDPNDLPLPEAKIFQGSQFLNLTDENGEATLTLSSINNVIRIEIPDPYVPIDTTISIKEEQRHYVINARHPQYYLLKSYDRGDGNKIEIWDKVTPKWTEKSDLEDLLSLLEPGQRSKQAEFSPSIPTIDTTMGLLVLDSRPDTVDCLIKSLHHDKFDTIITTPCEPLYLPPGRYSLVLSRATYQTWQDSVQIAQNQVTIVKKDLNRLTNTLKIKLRMMDLRLITANDSVNLKLKSEDTLAQRTQKLNKDSSEYQLKFENMPHGNYEISLEHQFYKLGRKEIKHDSSTIEHIVELKAKNKAINLFIDPIIPYAFKLDGSKVQPENTSDGVYKLPGVPFGKHKLTMTGVVGDSIIKDEFEIIVNDSVPSNYFRHFRPRYQFNHFAIGQTCSAFPPVADRFKNHILFKTDGVFPITKTLFKFNVNIYIQFKNSIDFYIRLPVQLVDSNKTVSTNGYGYGVKHNLISSKNWVLAGLFEYDNNLKCSEGKYSQNLNCIDLKILYSRKRDQNHFIDLNFGVSRYYGQDELIHSVVYGDILTMSVARRLGVSSSFSYNFDISGAFRLDAAKMRWDGALALSIDYRLSPLQLISMQYSTSFGTSRLLRIYHPHQFSRTVIGLSLLTFIE